MESDAAKNSKELEVIKLSTMKNSEDMESMKSQLAEIAKSLQVLANRSLEVINRDVDGGSCILVIRKQKRVY